MRHRLQNTACDVDRPLKMRRLDKTPPTRANAINDSNGHCLPMSNVEISDLQGGRWRLGVSVGVGSFGRVYQVWRQPGDSAHYVAKVEAHNSGPLFVEINCYLRIAKYEIVEQWKRDHNLAHLGMPHYVASGSFVEDSSGSSKKPTKYRFLVIPKYDGGDLGAILQRVKTLNLKTTLSISLQLVDVLEYIHTQGYIHCDIKASNILVQELVTSKKQCRQMQQHHQIYLMDYGLATQHKEESGRDERRAHAGTLLFCSVDAHNGVQSRRSDLESLLYNVCYWLSGVLPWREDEGGSAAIVCAKKIHYYHKDPVELLRYCFGANYPTFLLDFCNFLRNGSGAAAPDYQYLRRLFHAALADYGYEYDGTLNFTNSALKIRRQIRRRIQSSWSTSQKQSTMKTSTRRNHRERSSKMTTTTTSCNNYPSNSTNKNNYNNQYWSLEMLTDPEVLIKHARKHTECNVFSMSIVDLVRLNPTEAMWEVFNTCQGRGHSEDTSLSAGQTQGRFKGYTPAMIAVYKGMIADSKRGLASSEVKAGGVRKKGGKRLPLRHIPVGNVQRSSIRTRSTKSLAKKVERSVAPVRIKRLDSYRG